MTDISRRTAIVSTLALTACSQGLPYLGDNTEFFKCPPCGCSEDETDFKAPGRCPDCDMTLMPKHESKLGFAPKKLHPCAGTFELPGGMGNEHRRISVHYYLPDNFKPTSKVLLVIPGAGRNSFDYRNAWLSIARERNILVAALGYGEENYDLAAYNLGGVVKNFSVENVDTSNPNVIRAQDTDISFDINLNKDDWIFSDLDRVFDFLKATTRSETENYDVFGHSAGGQVLHRMALFYPSSKADKIIAANAGWYTMPDLNTPPPTGLQGFQMARADLINAFSSNLTILLGEKDNGAHAGGTLLRTPIVDRQGLGRLQRGQNFYKAGQVQAMQLGVPLKWVLKTVADVGHDYRDMSRAAAKLLIA